MNRRETFLHSLRSFEQRSNRIHRWEISLISISLWILKRFTVYRCYWHTAHLRYVLLIVSIMLLTELCHEFVLQGTIFIVVSCPLNERWNNGLRIRTVASISMLKIASRETSRKVRNQSRRLWSERIEKFPKGCSEISRVIKSREQYRDVDDSLTSIAHSRGGKAFRGELCISSPMRRTREAPTLVHSRRILRRSLSDGLEFIVATFCHGRKEISGTPET